MTGYKTDENHSNVVFEKWEHGLVQGIEIGPDGLIYLHARDQWASGMYKVDSAIKVFRLKSN